MIRVMDWNKSRLPVIWMLRTTSARSGVRVTRNRRPRPSVRWAASWRVPSARMTAWKSRSAKKRDVLVAPRPVLPVRLLFLRLLSDDGLRIVHRGRNRRLGHLRSLLAAGSVFVTAAHAAPHALQTTGSVKSIHSFLSYQAEFIID